LISALALLTGGKNSITVGIAMSKHRQFHVDCLQENGNEKGAEYNYPAPFRII
jgi:hypothetical protein